MCVVLMHIPHCHLEVLRRAKETARAQHQALVGAECKQRGVARADGADLQKWAFADEGVVCADFRPAEVGPAEVGPVEVGPAEVGPGERVAVVLVYDVARVTVFDLDHVHLLPGGRLSLMASSSRSQQQHARLLGGWRRRGRAENTVR